MKTHCYWRRAGANDGF